MSLVFCTHCTLPLHDCVCQFAPHIKLDPSCALLVHPREYGKRSNTGRLLKIATNIESYTWHRLKNPQLQAKFQHYALLYPDDKPSEPQHNHTSDHSAELNDIQGYLILDATWQEANKMMRQSPWLASLPRVSLKAQPSQYRLRRNQTHQGLSTLECIAYWLDEHNQRNCSQELLHFFNRFQDAYLHARQSGHLK